MTRVYARSAGLRRVIAVAALALAAGGCGGATPTPSAPPSPSPLPSAAAADPTRVDVQAFVEQAVAYARSSGRAAALATFTAPGGDFHQGQLYIFAYDFTGTVLAHGGDATLVGKNLIDLKDTNGVLVIRELVRLAETGSGWLDYTWPNPQHASAQEPKLGYVMKVDDGWFLGSGTYGAAAQATAQP